MRLASFVVLLLIVGSCFGQKPVIDSAAIDSWPVLQPGIISDNGRYLAYNIRHADYREDNVLEVVNCENEQKIIIPVTGNSFSSFANKDGSLVFKKTSDSLGILDIQSGSFDYVTNIRTFKIPADGNKTVIAYQLNSKDDQLVLRDLVKKEERQFSNVMSYFFNNEGTLLALVKGNRSDTTRNYEVSIYNIANKDSITIFKGISPGNFVFDHKGKHMAFLSKSEKGLAGYSIWLYQEGKNNAELICDGTQPSLDSGLVVNNDLLKFSNDDTRLFLHLIENKPVRSNESNVKVSIWKYNDVRLLSEKLQDTRQIRYLAVVNIDDKKMIRLEQENERFPYFLPDDRSDEFLVIVEAKGDFFLREKKWNTMALPSLYLVSTKDGTKRLVCPANKIVRDGSISPGGDYLVYYSPMDRNYFSYEISSGVTRNISKGIVTTWTTYEENDMPDSIYKPVGIAGWVKNANKVLIYNQHDIWLIDPSTKERPVNITQGFGQKNDIVFKLSPAYKGIVPTLEDDILLTGFHNKNKNSGFFLLGGKNQLKELNMLPYSYDFLNYPLIKAKDTGIYILRRMSATQFPNYFVTTDFKSFKQLTHLQPEKKYNWLSTELIKWKTADEKQMMGVLYKPDNFDSTKKYPIIFYYYERLTDRLNSYLKPEWFDGPINIPYLVSNGYLVFTPDIHYMIGYPLQSASNTVISAARYLTRFSWVNPKKMGIQGHSWGGYETNCIITQTDMFAAAMSAAGISDMIGDYGGISHRGSSRQFFYELNQTRIGAPLWEKPALYLKNSPVLLVNRINTPLLLMHNPDDGSVPISQSMELFTALRRLQKKVWLLQYAGEGHIVGDTANARDYTRRVKQFFDHYLKDQPAPDWMR